MPTPKPEPKYNCTQAELYAICKTGWGSYAENLADFTAFKTIYTALFGTDALGEVTAAQLMPDDQARGAAAEMLRISMTEAANTAILKWKSLRAYIKSSYPAAMVKPQEEAAGYGYYETATNYDWEDLTELLKSGATFITNNTAALTTGGMPAGFALAYTNAQTAFNDLYDDFKDSEQDSVEGTDVKMEANNDIYDKLIDMFEDGIIIYDNNAAKRKRFIFEQVKSLVTPPGGGGGGGIPATSLVVKGKVTHSVTGDPIVSAQVQANDVADPANVQVVNTNATGDYFIKFDGMAAGASISMHHRVTAPGFVTEDKNINMTVGQTHTVNVAMLPNP